eukprot:COSAG02_NODE_51981_length_310_cov_2.018957_1_plen_64_part_01
MKAVPCGWSLLALAPIRAIPPFQTEAAELVQVARVVGVALIALRMALNVGFAQLPILLDEAPRF